MRDQLIREDDFKNTELPTNRREQFFSLIKRRSRDIVRVSIFLFLFSIPIFASYLFGSSVVTTAHAAKKSTQEIFSIIFYFSFVIFLVVPIYYIGYNGGLFVYKKIMWGDGDLGATTFFKGIKENIKVGIFNGLLAAISSWCFMIGSLSLASMQIHISVRVIGIALLTLQFILVIIICNYNAMQSVCYSNSLFRTLKNSFLFSFAKAPSNLLFFVLKPGIFIILCIVHPIAGYIAIVVFLIASGYLTLMTSEIIMSGFDAFINKTTYPDYYRKGLYIEKINTKEEK